MGIEIRAAYVRDAEAIQDIIQLAFDDAVNIERLQRLLSLSHNFTYVAVQSEDVVGFIDNFLTVSSDNYLRLELDLLAVHPEAQGQGIAKRLIEASIEQARNLGVREIRALVASQNEVMQRACKRIGLMQSVDELGLYVISPRQVASAIEHKENAHLIQVNTLTYAGIWLEGKITASTIQNAHMIGHALHVDTIGAVVNRVDSQTTALLTEQDFSHVGNYHWWTLNLADD